MIQIKEVTTKKDLKAFVHFPNALYKGNPYYVPQIESMDRDTLTPEKNHAFEVCESKYWLRWWGAWLASSIADTTKRQARRFAASAGLTSSTTRKFPKP